MFCPKCGAELIVGERGSFSCPRGLDFSTRLSDLLREQYDTGASARAATTTTPSGRYFCPGCRAPLESLEKPCASCGRSLTKPIMFQLIEFHPHPDGRGSFY